MSDAPLIEMESEGEIRCIDPDCEGMAEPELDGDHAYYTCQVCGMDFGYSKIETNMLEGSCQVGVPESIRRAVSGAPQPELEGTPVFIGRKK